MTTNQKEINIKRFIKNYTIETTPYIYEKLENLSESELIRSQNQTSRHNIKFIQIVRWQMKILPLLRTTDHQIYFIFDV